jgi:hypothetical protein
MSYRQRVTARPEKKEKKEEEEEEEEKEKTEKKKRSKTNSKKIRTFKSYIKRLVKKQEEDVAVGKKTLRILDHMILDVINRVTKHSSDMLSANRAKKNRVLGYRVVASSFRLVFRDKVFQEEMHNYAQKAVDSFSSEKKKKKTVM